VRAGEAARWLAALAGLLLWLCIPLLFIYVEPPNPCHGQGPDCMHDYIPVLEFLFLPLFTLATAYPFARFAFSLYAPPPPRAGRIWGLAARDGAAAHWPLLAVFAGLGCAWTLWRTAMFLGMVEPVEMYLFRFAFILWFVAGIVVGWRDSRRARAEL